MNTLNRIDESLFPVVLQQLHAPLIITDHLHTIQFVNEQFLQLSGFSENELIDRHIRTIYNGKFDHFLEGQREIDLKRKENIVSSQLATISHVHVNGNNYSVFFFTPCDQCGIDPLTKLPNRSSFERAMKYVLSDAKKHDTFFALLFIDLDRFKFVNDTLGHSSGDDILKQVTVRIKKTVKKNFILTRVGGDEFICVLKNMGSKNDAEQMAMNILNTFKEPFLIREIEIFLTASIGISFYPFDGDDLETLMTNADAAMYRAKKKGKNCIETAGVEISAGSFEKLLIENSLRKSIENDELFLQYQPQIDLKTNEVVGFEALVRWNHPELGLISPGEFIPIAEETGLIIPIGDWVLNRVCEKLNEWKSQGYPSIRISVNLSVQQFLQKNIVEKIYSIVANYGVHPNQLELELTESLFMHDIDKAIITLKKLRSLGFRISIDDFGTGFSSLSYLQQLPVNNLKIDRSFIKDIDTNPSSKTLTKTITSLAHDLQLEVVVEGVETLKQLVQIKKSSCDMVQGYYFSKPLSEDKVINFLQTPSEQEKTIN